MKSLGADVNKSLIGLFVGAVCALFVTACGGGGESATSDTEPPCQAGSFGCECDSQGTCDGALACVDGTCQVEETCEAGTLGCECFANQSCSGALSCNTAQICEEPPVCTPGSLGCPCNEGACDAADAFCDAELETCQRVDCPAGEEGCGCGAQDSCGLSTEGEVLTCQAGVCQSSDCAAGQDGCVCRGGFECDGDGSTCTEGYCMSDACAVGQEGCLCAGGTCGPGLRCQDDTICVDNTGFAQGACDEEGQCRRGNRCQRDICVTCTLGSQGCHCRDDNSCNDGLGCDADTGLCANDRGLASDAPQELVCYTPCSSGVELDNGRFVPCPADGLMPGCFGDTECNQGQCLREGAEPQTCARETDCPDFQACLGGVCASNCDTSADCVEGSVCQRHVCRETCTVADGEGGCGQGSFCQLLDGDNGVCMANVPATTTISQEPIDTFSITPEAMSLSGVTGTQPLVITNKSASTIEITLTRRDHILFEADGDLNTLDFEEGCQAPACPMWWLDLSVNGELTSDSVATVTIPSGESAQIEISERQRIDQPRWQGSLDISSATGGTKTLVLSRSAQPTGEWTGEAYYFGSFKDNGIKDWVAEKDNPAMFEGVENAFLRHWINFREGRLSFDQFQAGLVSTRTESWRSPRIYELGCDPGHVCYPFNNFDGFLTYTTDPTNIPVPSGVVEMPMAFNIRPAVGEELGEDCVEGQCFRGRIESSKALQYAGIPQLDVAFESDPEGCSERGGDECLTFLNSFEAALSVGARYNSRRGDSACSGQQGLTQARIPWLIEGLVGRSELDEETGQRYTYDCLDNEAPLPLANPVPDGRLRYRNIELIDGALINNDTLFVIFRERLETFLWDNPTSQNGIEGYGYFMMRKSEAALSNEAYTSAPVPSRDNQDRFLRPIECTDNFLGELGIDRRDLDTNPDFFADVVALAVIDGVVTDTDSLGTVDPDAEAVHYLCEDTGLFDGGPDDDRVDSPVEKVECPEGSRVTFFTLSLVDPDAPLLDNCGGLSLQNCHQAFMASLDCQRDENCQQQLNRWTANERHGIRTNPYFVCDDPNRAFCNDNRQDLREGKTFFGANNGEAVLRPMLTEVGDAFRYRTRFVNRRGVGLGFVPEICVPDSNLTPYCYDPVAIEDIRERVECGMELYTDFYDVMSETQQQRLLDLLIENFSSAEEIDVFNRRTTRRGFEFLDTELMIMLGDEHYTRALASRFDLASTQVSSFEGELFEPDGINLSGVAGAEMHNLYASIQYYQMTLDRFYDLSPLIAGSVENARDGGQPSFITPASVESYFGRLIRASTQKSRAWADIAERYQNFNRPDLSRRVIERAYTAAYLESMILTRLMQEIVDITAPEDIAQLQRQIEFAQRSYRVAMSVMRQHYLNITDDLNFFGFAPDFIPFPALQGLLDSSFEVVRQRAQERINLALTSENIALESNRDFNVNTASFQNELARLENTYDAQLSELCGTFEVDGQIYPAIAKYAYLSPETRVVGDPCGLVGNGQIHVAMSELDVVLTEMRRVSQSIKNTNTEAEIEGRRLVSACDAITTFADLQFDDTQRINNLENFIGGSRAAVGALDRTISDVATAAQLGKCLVVAGTSNGTDCPSAIAGLTSYGVAFAAYQVARTALDAGLVVAEGRVRDIQRGIDFERELLQCQLAEVDSLARVETILLQIEEQKLEALKAEYQMNQNIAQIQQLRNQAIRLQQEMAETEELAINVEAARNNPNVRIYKNDAILNADVTFYSALREVYKATRVFESYTSQSYGPLEQLFLTRMVGRGDFNLQLYMIELEDAFREFEEEFGLPSRRLEIISLKNDILNIPRIDLEGSGAALSESERTTRFRTELSDVRHLDDNGYITLPFSTNDSSLSPLTRNHKISHIEAEIIGGGQGDLLARVYLRMAGTSRVSALNSEDPIFYTFPERLAVLNPFFEGSKPLHIDQDVYRNRTLFDRPLVNSRWEFVLNTLDEEVNQDLNISSLDDIRLYVYYNDFTQF